jgi:hypothetical protein
MHVIIEVGGIQMSIEVSRFGGKDRALRVDECDLRFFDENKKMVLEINFHPHSPKIIAWQE